MQPVFAGYSVVEPIKYRGSIDTRDDATGAPVTLWTCQHQHDTHLEATACAETQLRHALELTKEEAP